MSSLGFGDSYFAVGKGGISQFQTMVAYLGGSAFQTIVDNPVTAFRQLVQQYAVDLKGNVQDPTVARQEAMQAFKNAPMAASLSGLGPRLIGVGFKRVPKFGSLLAISFFLEKDGKVGYAAATGASIVSAPFINPVRMVEKQQRAYFKQSGATKPIMDILREAAAQNFRPLFRGTIPLMGHSLASATTGLVGQPVLEKKIRKELGATGLGQLATGLISSSIVSPIYVVMTNPLSRLEVIMQTSSIQGKAVSLPAACKEILLDSKTYGLRGIFRGQGIGVVKAIISLTTFHQGRIYCMDWFKERNVRLGYADKK
ncbi:hypothetical protein TeGR_g8232 [Tetraparma gracilis]|uniref:Mitochondrial carrier protein n=1 Tax=Tetraparma gracilis TaxID=2962635 RepID=A0ABQ6MBT1_9STRA|nr:hypothetical protein TeGR_g8232 [Tetraparma gracilis]